MSDRINLPQLREQIGHYDCDDEQPGVRTVEIKVVSVLALIDTVEAAHALAEVDGINLVTKPFAATFAQLKDALARFDFGDHT